MHFLEKTPVDMIQVGAGYQRCSVTAAHEVQRVQLKDDQTFIFMKISSSGLHLN